MKKEYSECLSYIEEYWDKATFSFKNDEGVFLGVPNKFVSPNHKKFKQDIFYWDSYFIILGLLESNRVELAKGIVDNFLFLFNRLHFVPVRNRIYNAVISQPPFLTSMALLVFEKDKDKKWLRKVAEVAEDELDNYWMDEVAIDPNIDMGYKKKKLRHLSRDGLSRYCDHYGAHLVAEHESGWDMTSRFGNRCLDYLPVDLNCLLYKYEIDLAKIHGILGDGRKEGKYLKEAETRKKTVNKLMWDKKREFFFDYNDDKNKRSDFYSLAGFFPLWSGLATHEQADKMVKSLKIFEYKGGLATTQRNNLLKNRDGSCKQWDYPNGWANLEWIVIKGLLDYGFRDSAKRLALKWLDMNERVFKRTNNFWEKYNVIKGREGRIGRYRVQDGFGWTNAVFLKLVKEFVKK